MPRNFHGSRAEKRRPSSVALDSFVVVFIPAKEMIMNNERKELADLFARYLDGTLADDDNIDAWERLQKSDDSTVVNGYQVLVDQIEDTMFDVEILDKSEWDYVERVRLALLSNARIVKRRSFRFGWRNLLSGVGFFSFVMIAAHYGVGYHLLPVTALFALAIFAFSTMLPKGNCSFPYQSILSPFVSFSDLKLAYENADSFKKRRYSKSNTRQSSLFGRCFGLLIASCLMAVVSPVILLVLAFPDTEPEYHAVVG